MEKDVKTNAERLRDRFQHKQHVTFKESLLAFEDACTTLTKSDNDPATQIMAIRGRDMQYDSMLRQYAGMRFR